MAPKLSAEAEAARALIERLKNERLYRPDGTLDANAQTLSDTLKVLSTELYTRSTRFIPELIQNGDDNDYSPGVEPTMTFTYRDDGYLWIGCNEVGFSEENVRAICNANKSTKANSGLVKAYIGEKGIGFKSVYKVADIVWVLSGDYAFQFRRDEDLGMIVPHNCTFKACPLGTERTMFCLRIPQKEDRATVRGDLLGLGAELLLFLRKLRTIRVNVIRAKEHKITHSFELRRNDANDAANCILTTLTRHDLEPSPQDDSETMAVFRHLVTGMPKDNKRDGIGDSELIMAFPCRANPQKENRKTYNFLPIRHFGFRFILHADFILTASRQDILGDRKWNDKLRDESIKLFAECVKHFNQSGRLKHTWPRFLSLASENTADTVMAGYIGNLRRYLRSKEVLESQAGRLQFPPQLEVLHPDWRDGSKKPLLDEANQLHNYVSDDYSADLIQCLGVNPQKPSKCCTLLKKMSLQAVQEKPTTWHIKLAEVLGTLPENQLMKLKEFKFIPVQGGGWRAASDTSLFISDAHSVEIPQGIDISLVEHNAAQKYVRAKLFHTLGIQKIDSSGIGGMIIKTHRSLRTRFNGYSPEAITDHAWYLYRAGFKSDQLRESLKLAKYNDSEVALGNTLYMDDVTGGFVMSAYFDKFDIEFISPRYLAKAEAYGPEEMSKWQQWLRNELGVETVPRLITKSDTLGTLFKELIDRHPSQIWLELLRDHWDRFFLGRDITPEELQLNSQLVDCITGSRKPLNELFLPTPAIRNGRFHVPDSNFVDIQDPEHAGWEKFSLLGLAVKPSLRLYLSILRETASDAASQPDRGQITKLFEAIERYSRDSPQNTREIFEKEALIPTLNDVGVVWLKSTECRWSAPPGIKKFVPLDMVYPSSTNFFTKVLGVVNANVFDAVFELAAQVGDLNNLNSIHALFLAISDLLDDESIDHGKLQAQLPAVFGRNVFPIRKAAGQVRLASSKNEDWFIADRHRHMKCFEGKVWILAFPDKDIEKMSRLFEYSGLFNRYLSNRIVEFTESDGSPVLVKNLTQQLQAKAQFFAMLVGDEDEASTFAKMKVAQVFSCKAMKLRRSVEVDGSNIYGADEIGRVVLEEQGAGPKLIFREQNIRNNTPWASARDRLAQYLNITEERRLNAVETILSNIDSGLIRDRLERADLWKGDFTPEKFAERAATESSHMKNEPRLPKQKISSSNATKKPYKDEEMSDAPDLVSGSRAMLSSHTASNSAHKSDSEKPSRALSSDGDIPPTYEQSQESQLFETIANAAEQYDISTVTVIGPLSGDEATSLTATDLLQPSFETKQIEEDCGADTQLRAELFVHHVLLEHFEAPVESWISAHRTRLGLPVVGGPEQYGAAFTITDPAAAQSITTWLADRGYRRANDWLGCKLTYHIDVEPTAGDSASQPFVLSQEQMEAAQEWHKDPKHAYLILRVYQVSGGDPKFVVWVNPFGMMLTGKLECAAMGGFAVRVARDEGEKNSVFV